MATASLKEAILDVAAAGQQLTELLAAEGSAGNISVALGHEAVAPPPSFPYRGEVDLPIACPKLAGSWVVITGSGKRLRDLQARPEETLCLLQISTGGETAQIYGDRDIKPTSEMNSHLAIHADFLESGSIGCHAVVHAQPLHLTFLSHMDRYSSAVRMTTALFRWQPETVLVFPEGIEVLPFAVPGSEEQMHLTRKAMLTYRCVVWRKHGVITHSSISAVHAADLVEYVEAAARYEALNLSAGDVAGGLTMDELKLICERNNVRFPFPGETTKI